MMHASELPIALPISAAALGGARSRAMPAMRVLLIDDDDDFRQSLSFSLLDEGFAVTACATGAAAFERLAEGEAADVVVLDWRLPGMNGLEVLHELRRRGFTTPVIFLTALCDDIYEEEALAGGAVDFIPKSRRQSILFRRIELIADPARPLAEARQPAIVRLGALELRFDINRASWRGRPIELTMGEFRLVALIALKRGGDVSYRDLYDLVRGKDFAIGSGSEGYRANVRTFIKRIRKKFRSADPAFDQIQNYPRFGYRWVIAA